jgi:hypothetical protein
MLGLGDIVHKLAGVHTDRVAAVHMRVGYWGMAVVDKTRHQP